MNAVRHLNYNEISNIYDDVREVDQAIIQHLIEGLPSRSSLRILDIGCGTGNHTDLLQKLTQVQVYGLEPSEGMLEKARQKNPHITFKCGSADQIPFEGNYFDFVYMTDVVHHLPDIPAMFAEIWRVMKSGGKGCIVTQSHQQIEARPIARYFPGTVSVDKDRYPDIPALNEFASDNGFTQLTQETITENMVVLDGSYLELVRKKGYSMLHLISNNEFQAGLGKLEGALSNGPVAAKPAGSTLVWFTKPKKQLDPENS